jgi:hypothetical protein
MPYGFEGTDTGYIFGTSWNIYNGQLPHRDFIYTRPAIPAYVHTIFLFISETYGYLLDRSFFFVQVFLYSYLGARLVAEKFRLKSTNIMYFLAILGALFSIHNYPPMGWNTIDGIFFCIIAMYLIVRETASIGAVAVGTFYLVLGVFSKQSFYFMPVFIFAYLLFNKAYRKTLWFCAFSLFFLACYIGFKYATGTLLPFWEQTFVRTPTSGLVNSGIKAYYLALKFNIIWVLGICLALFVLSKWVSRNVGFLLVHGALAAFMLWVFLHDANSWTKIPYVFQFLFLASALLCVWRLRNQREYALLLLLLGLSWSAAISNGYRTPIHFSLPFIVCLYLYFFPSEEKTVSPQVAWPVMLLYLGVFFVGYQTLYRDSERSQLTYPMGEVFPQLRFIKSDRETFEKYSELKELARLHPDFTVVPSVTLAHYLTGTINPIGTDWPHDVEINYQGQQLIRQLEEQQIIVFIETSEFSSKELEDYQMKKHIEEHWTLLNRYEYFDVYSPTQPPTRYAGNL